MKKVLKELRPFKKPLILLGIIIGVLIFLTKILPFFQEIQANKTPISSISATNDRSYASGEIIKAADFEIKAKHESGKFSTVKSKDVELSTSRPEKTGKYTEVKITLKENKKISTTVKVKNQRTKVEEFPCGNPNIKDVKAVLYSNGELCFEGEGNVLQYDEGQFPWQNSQSSINIISVSFEEGVKPTSMDNWFQGMQDLTYISPLPDSVKSVVGMCKGCTSLTEAPDWSNCTELLDVSEAYTQCTSLVTIPALPASIRNASKMCSGCEELQKSPDLTGATNLVDATEMFDSCKKLTQPSNAPSLKIMDSMYRNCINLEFMPDISNTVTSMESTFEGDVSLTKLKTIPSSVQSVMSCFNGCTKVTGELEIDCNPDNYSGFLNNAANATQLNLTGSSKMLEVLANTSENGNILVNGKMPNPEITSIEDVE